MGHTQDYFRDAGMIIDAVDVVRANTTLNQFDLLRCNDGGTICLKVHGHTTNVEFKNLDAGEWVQVNTDYVMTTSTTSTDIIGCTLGRSTPWMKKS